MKEQKNMLGRLLFRHQKTGQLLIASSGSLIGFLLLLGALQLYMDMQAVFSGDLSKPQYMVINKSVSLINTIFGGQKGFTPEEIQEIRNISGVQKAAPLTSSKFKVNVTMGESGLEGIPGMYTELFFEAVPDDFVSDEVDFWQWSEGDSVIPVIIPKDYIRLYNFGFAPAQGLPQLTENIVKMARFKIAVKGGKGSAVFEGRLAGFSERINSILAPQAFVDYANETFAGVAKGQNKTTRVILSCNGEAAGKLSSYFSDKGYETGAEALRNSKMNAVLTAVMNVLGILGIVIIVLALSGFLLYAQLLISKSSYEIDTLIRIGFDYRKLTFIYIRFYAVIYTAVLLISLVGTWFLNGWFSHYMAQNGFEFSGMLSIKVVLAGLVFMLLFLGINFSNISRQLKRTAQFRS